MKARSQEKFHIVSNETVSIGIVEYNGVIACLHRLVHLLRASSTKVTGTVSDLIPIRMNTSHGVSIHIPFYTTDKDGATVQTTTYKTFLKNGFSTIENTSTGVKLVDIPE